MAFHADGAGDGEAVLRYATSAAHRAAGLASHQEAAAQFGRALRFAAGADPATAGALYDGLAREASLIDRWQDAADAGEHALALWRGRVTSCAGGDDAPAVPHDVAPVPRTGIDRRGRGRAGDPAAART